jgi:hypothetical protein
VCRAGLKEGDYGEVEYECQVNSTTAVIVNRDGFADIIQTCPWLIV